MVSIKNKFKSTAFLVAATIIFLPDMSFASTDPTVETLATTQVQGIVEIKYSNGSAQQSAPLWTGTVPTRVRFIKPNDYQTCAEVKFQVQSLLPYDTIVNASTSVGISFELWSLQGEKVAYNNVSSYTWNPLNGPTMVVWLECGDWLVAGSYNLIIRTEQTLSTTGLLSRYLKGTVVVPFVIDPPTNKSSTTYCKKGNIKKTFKKLKCPAGWKNA